MENVHRIAPLLEGDSFATFIPQLHVAELSDSDNLSERLQITLDLDLLLEIYANYAVTKVNFASLVFERPGRRHRITLSDHAQHAYQFPIGIGGHRLGEITYQALLPLADSQLDKLKRLHRKLAFPLRNAILHDQLRQQALTDLLTGLGNRAAFDDGLRRAMEQARRTALPLGLLLLDLDNFKQVNDREGHLRGDEVLADFAALLRQSLRTTDSPYRLGGDEFAVIVHDPHAGAAERIAERLRAGLDDHAGLAASGIGVSIGFALVQPGDDPRRLCGRADAALYRAKASGKNQLHSDS